MSLRNRLKAAFGAGKEVPEELEFHVLKETELNIASGMSPDEARRQALVAFGGVQQTREAVAEQRGLRLVETTIQDFRYALRMLRKSPAFAAISMGILAVGIGANAAVFSAVNAILFARWPIPRQQQLVLAKEIDSVNQGWLVSVPNFYDYQRRQKSFQQLALWMDMSVNLTGQERPDRLVGGFVSANFFEMLDVKAANGRTFLPGEDQPGAVPVAVITYGAWQGRFGADPHILGRSLIINNEPYTVVGIMPKGFSLPWQQDEIFLAMQRNADFELKRKIRSFLLLGRLKDGVSRSQAAADLNTTAQDLARTYPVENAGIRIELIRLQELMTQRVRTPMLVLLGSVALVLLIVCANMANLLLARGAARQREIAVRAALGAARNRLVRQFLCESLTLAFLGGALGILLAQLLLKVLESIVPVNVTINPEAGVDPRVLAFTAAISILTGLIFGVAPALQFSRVNLSPALAGGSRTSTHPSSRLRSGFAVLQVAISVVLVVSAALLVKSFHVLITADPGFVPDHLLTMEYRLPPNKYRTPEAQLNFHRQMLARVEEVPGVKSAALIQALPFSGNWEQTRFKLLGQPASDQQNGVAALNNAVSPEYFSTIGIPLLEGRLFSVHDDETSPGAAIVNRTFVQKYFAKMDPIGWEIVITDVDPLALGAEHGITKRAVIVGVVGSAKQRFVREELEPQVYFPYAQVIGTFGTLVIRTGAEPMSLAEAVRQAVWSVDKDQPVWKVRTLDSLIEKDTAPDRFVMLLMSALSGLALFLSALGTYGMLSNMVTQRTRELGVRMALGAPIGSVVKLVLNHGFKLLLIGCGFGVVGAILCARLLGRLLYGVAPQDLSAYALGLTVMAIMGLVASYLPARRATRVDPMMVLREE